MACNTSAMSLRRRPSIARLLVGISGGAASLALASMPAPALAQAVNGTPTPQFGISGVSRSTPGLDAVFVTSNEALLDWTASDSGGVFLPEGNTLRFIYDGSSPYTVLNRVTDTAVGGPLSIAGTVESSSLGKIWFYNAGGWVVGPTGVFNVGSLVLTSLPITIDPASDTVSRLYGDKNEIRFGTALDPKSSVAIQSGAQINASLANSSYVAVVAPRVEQAGTVSVNGSAAYVAAEAATMTINSGLFDIIVDSGSDDTEGVVHTGTTQWPANASSTDANHRIYLVAVPKNQAMTAVVSGAMGYKGATAASVVDGSIVLSAGYNVAGGSVSTANAVGGNASLAISGLTVGQKGATSDLTGFATRDVTIDASTTSTSVRGTVNLQARRNVLATIGNDSSIVVDSGLSLGSMNGAKAGNVSVAVAGGSLNVGGTLDLYSIATGAVQTDPLNGDALLAGSVGEDAVSGDVELTVTDGNFNLGGATLSSIATSGVGELSAGSATSGSVSIDIAQTDGAASTFGGSLGSVALYTNAVNGFFSLQAPIAGGNATSGAATLAVDGGTFDSTGISLGSDAVTFAGTEARPLDATAGAVSISFANGNGIYSTGGIDAGNYASASDGGLVTLGDVSLAYDNVQSFTSVSVGRIDLQSYAFGNLAAPNTVSLSLSRNSRLDTNESAVSLVAEGRDATGTQLAGNVAFVGDASTLIASRLDMTSQAIANNSGVDAVGGNVSAIMRNSADITLIETAVLVSKGTGGSGADGSHGTGGDVSFNLADSSFSGTLDLLSNGVAGRRNDAAGRSGTGLGGKVTFSQTGKPASLFANTVSLSSLGQGGRPDISSRTGLVAQAGDGAAGIGGDVSFSVGEGTFSASSLSVGANGEGGNADNAAGFAPGTGGSGTGGTATLSVTGGLLTVSTVDVTASGFGGDGAQSSDTLGIVGGIGGAGTGGSASVNLTGGALRTQGLTIEANGNKSQPDGSGISYFGNGGYDFFGNGAAGDGGLGTGGNALLTIDGGTLGEIAFSSAGFPVTVTVNAIGEGGAGGYTFGSSGAGNRSGAGGNGQGGTAGIRFLSGTFDAQTVGIDATGLGGLAGNEANATGEFALNAGKGGDGSGGTSTLEILSDLTSATLAGSTRSVDVRADGLGQSGESGLIGGAGGSGLGGTARILANGGNSSLSGAVLSAEGLGGAGGNSTDGYVGGAGGSGTGGLALFAVTGDGTQLGIGNASLRVSGLGGAGGRGGFGSDSVDEAGDGGAGGTGTGGAINLTASDLGQLVVTGTSGSSFAANGIGGAGGLGGNSASNGWQTLGDGGDGGTGRGGAFDALAQGGGVVTFDDLTLNINGQGGAGGSFVSLDVSGTLKQSVGGAGGAGFGGSISLQAVGLDSLLEAPSLVANANGRGGAGVNGFGYAADGSSADGSAGGSATGGNISILADASGAIAIAALDGNVALSANGTGGNGGRALAAITAATGIGGNGGNGGNSGSGTGGTIAIAALDTGSASLGLLGTVTLSANGTGGIAGLGGDGASSTAPATLGGNGGNNGLAIAGSGGTVTVGATGGTATFGTLLANATGEAFDRPFAGAGGGGTSGFGLSGSSAFVTPSGGQVSFTSADGSSSSPGSLVAGATSVDVRSKRTFPASNFAFIYESGGTISLTSSSTAPADAMRFTSFLGDASGSSAGFSDPAISLTALAGPITFDSDLTLLAAGSISVSVSDGLTVASGGNAHFVSDTGIDIAATGTGQFSANSILLESFGSIGIAVNGCATATCRPIEATTSLVADASGDFTISGPAIVAGLGSLDVYAFGNVTGDAASGYFSGGSLRVRAGQDATIRNATGASLNLEAGAIPDGTTLYYDGLLTLGEASGGGVFNATGDIMFASGGAIAVTDGNSFSAGTGIDVRSGNDIVVGQNNDFLANTSAAVPGLPVTFAAGGLTLQYTLAADDIATLSFGQGTTVASGTGAIALSGAAIDARLASFTGASFRADVLQSLGLASPRSNDGGRLDPDCLEGAICIGDVDVAGTVRIGNSDTVPLDIRAVGRIAGSDIRLLATGNVTLQGVGRVSQIVSTGNLSIRSVLREIALLGGATVEGGTVRLAAGTNISGTGNVTAKVDDIGLFAGGDIDAASLTAARELTTDIAAGGAVEGAFSTSGALRVSSLTLGTNADITTGKSLEIGALALGGFNGTLKAGTLLDLGSTTTVNDLSLTAGTSVGFTSIAVDGNLGIFGPSVTGTNAQAGGTLSITSDDLAADLLQSAGDLTLTVTNTAALGTVSSTGGSVFIDPALLTFTAITSASGISLAGGTITGGTLDAGTSIDVTATGALTLASANAGTTLALNGADIDVGLLDAGTDLTLTATNSINIGTSASAPGTITLAAPDIAFKLVGGGSAILTGGKVTGGDFSGDTLSVDITGALTLGSVVGNQFDLKAGSILANSIQGLTSGPGFDVALTATGGITVGAVSSGNDLRISSAILDATTLDAVRNITVNTSGTATIGGAIASQVGITAGNLGIDLVDAKDVTIDVTGDATLGSIQASTGTVAIIAGALSFDTIQSLTTTSLTAGSIVGNTVGAGTLLTVRATGSVNLADVTAGSLDLAVGDLQLGNLLTSGAASLRADATANIDTANVGSLDYRAVSASFGTIDTTGAVSITGGTVSGNAINAGTLLSITATDLDAVTLAANGNVALAVTDSAALGTVTSSGGSVTIDPATLTFDAVTAFGDITLSGGTITGGTLDAGASLDVSATEALALTSARSGTTLSLTADSLQAGGLDAETDLTLATTGSLSLTDIANAGGAITATFSTFDFVGLNADGLLDLSGTDLAGNSIVAGGDANITLTGDYAVSSLTGSGNLLFGAQTTSGAIIDVIGNADVTVAGLSSLLQYVAGGTLSLTAGELSAQSLDGANVDAHIAGAATLASGNAGVNFALTAGSLDAGTLRAGGDLSLAATGLIGITGDASAGGNFSITSADLIANTLTADGGIDIGVTSGASLVSAVAGQFLTAAATDLSFSSLSAADIQINAGSVSGGAVSAANALSVTSTGLVDLDSAVAGGALSINSGSLTVPTVQSLAGNVTLAVTGIATIGDLSALAGDVAATAGRLNFGSASATGQVQLGAAGISGGVVNAGTSAIVSATNTMLLDTITAVTSVELDGGNIDVNAVNAGTFADYTGRNVRVGATDAGTSAAVVARNFTFDTLAANDSVGIRTSLDIVGGSIDAGTTLDISAAVAVTLDAARAGGAIRARFATLGFNLLDSGGLLDLAGTDLAGTSIVTGGGAGIALTGNYDVGSITGSGNLTLGAMSANSSVIDMGGNVALTIVDTAALGTVTSRNGAVSIDPVLLTFDAITAASDITLIGGTITGGTLDAGASIDVAAAGTLALDSAVAGTTLSLSGANVQAGSLHSDGAISLTADDLVSITSAINAGTSISINAARFTAPLLQSNSGNVTLAISGRADLTNVAALGGDLAIDAGTLRFTSASASGAVRLGGADIAGTTVTSGTSTSIGTTSVANVGTITAGSSATLTGPSVTVAKVTAGTFTDFDGTVINVGDTTAGTTAFIDARDFTFDKLAAGQSVEILTTGNANGGRINAGTTLKITSRGDVKFEEAKAGGAITIGAANIDALTVSGDAGLSLTATNAINLGTVKVLGSFDLSGGSLVLGTSNSGLDSTLSLTGDATIGSMTAGLASTGQNLVQVVVQALANSYTGGTLLPVFDVVQGQIITVSSSTNDLWSAGALPRFSDGDGLVVFRLASAQDDSGLQPGTQIGAAFGNLGIGNFSAPFGALVGQVGSQNVLLGANGVVTAPATGTLSVGYWDSNAGDNTGSIAFTFGTGTGSSGVSNPANVTVTTGGNLTAGSVNASRAIILDAGAALNIDTADAGTALSLAGNTINAGALKAGTDITLESRGASLLGSATAGGGFSASTGGLDFTLIDAADAVDIATLAGVRGGNIIAGTSILIEADGSIVIGSGTAGNDIALTGRASANVTAAALVAGGAIGIEAGDVLLTSATAGGNFNASVRSLASPTISAGGSFTVSGTGTVKLGTATAGSALSITSQTITFNRLTSAGTIDLVASGNVSGGDAVATGRIGVNAGGRLAYGALDGGAIGIVSRSVAGGALLARTGDLNLYASGDASIGAVNAAGYVGIDADLLAFSNITAGGGFGTTNERMTGTSISAGQDISISTEGDVSLSGLSGRAAVVQSDGVVNIIGVQLSGPISVSADAVGLDATGNLAIRRIFADKGNVDVSAGGSIDADTIFALGDIDLLARDGDVTVSHLSAGYSDVFSDTVRQQGQVSGAIGQGNIDIVASDNIVINDVADAAKLFTMTAGDTIRLNGLATGAQMDLSSADLAIGAGGRLGETAHTSAITLRNTGQGVTRLGDNIPSTTSGYAISQAEFDRIRSRGDLTIRGTRPMLVGDLAVVAQAGTVQGQIGETGTMSLRSTGLISFLGALSMSNAAGNTLSVSSGGDGIFLDAQTGSIRLLEGETRRGSLLLSGSGIAMVTRTALEDIAQLTDTALITDRLGLNDGVTDGRTLVEADAITLRSDEQVYIQNTSIGTRLDDRRGLVANSLKIGSREGGVLDIVINGIVNGQTGVDAIEQITFEEAFTDLSSVNGCVILSANTCNKLPFEIIELRDFIEEVLKNDPADSALQVTDSFTKTTLIQLNQIAPAGFEPLIDEPVTGTGNDDLLGQGKPEGE